MVLKMKVMLLEFFERELLKLKEDSFD